MFCSQSDQDHQPLPSTQEGCSNESYFSYYICPIHHKICYIFFCLSNLLSSQKMLGCRKRKQQKGICNTSLQNITIVGSTTLLLLLFGLFLYCFYFVYTTGFLPNKPYFKFDKTPVQTMTKSLHLEKSILGRFFLTKYLCHLCIQLVHGAFL